MFVNVSNHPSAAWSEKQLKAAHVYGEIQDVPFPNVPPTADKQEVAVLAQKTLQQVMAFKPDCVMCSGEFTLTYALVSLLKEAGVRVVAACSERHAQEYVDEQGRTVKTSRMDFVCFREF